MWVVADLDDDYIARISVEPKAGRHFTFATPDRSVFEFAKVAFEIAFYYMQAKTIYLRAGKSQYSLPQVADRSCGCRVWLRDLGAFHNFHYTPTHGSWRDQAEIEIGDVYATMSGSAPNTGP